MAVAAATGLSRCFKVKVKSMTIRTHSGLKPRPAFAVALSRNSASIIKCNHLSSPNAFESVVSRLGVD